MTPTVGHYSLIQYCPDLSRMEVVNVGLVVICHELGAFFLETDPDLRRVRRFFGNAVDVAEVALTLEDLRGRIEAERSTLDRAESLAVFARLLANELIMTRPRPMSIADFAQDTEALFTELVAHDYGEGLEPISAVGEDAATYPAP